MTTPSWKDKPDAPGLWRFVPYRSPPRWVDCRDHYGLAYMANYSRERGRFCGPYEDFVSSFPPDIKDE